MFAQFSARLYENAARDDYRLATTNGAEFADATHWVAEKNEMATIVLLNVINAAKIDFERVKSYDKKIRENADGQQITSVYILAGGEIPAFGELEEYFGQAVYSIFWHVNLETGEITVPNGVPKKIFNVREMVVAATKNEHSREEKSFSEITNRVNTLRPRAKYRHAIMSYTIIFINALVLMLMYFDGYTAGNVSVAVRFGAIVVDDVVFRGEWQRLFSAMFIHFGFGHFVANAFGILIFGSRVERYFGRAVFLIVYIFSGLTGSVFSLIHLYLRYPYTVSAGASGAVFGIVGALFAFTRITSDR